MVLGLSPRVLLPAGLDRPEPVRPGDVCGGERPELHALRGWLLFSRERFELHCVSRGHLHGLAADRQHLRGCMHSLRARVLRVRC